MSGTFSRVKLALVLLLLLASPLSQVIAQPADAPAAVAEQQEQGGSQGEAEKKADEADQTLQGRLNKKLAVVVGAMENVLFYQVPLFVKKETKQAICLSIERTLCVGSNIRHKR